MDEVKVAEAIHVDLIRQSQSDDYDAPWIDEWHELKKKQIDGYVNLVELARAAIAACSNEGTDQ